MLLFHQQKENHHEKYDGMKEMTLDGGRSRFCNDFMNLSRKSHKYLVHHAICDGMGQSKERYCRKECSIYFSTLFSLWIGSHWHGRCGHVILGWRDIRGWLHNRCIVHILHIREIKDR